MGREAGLEAGQKDLFGDLSFTTTAAHELKAPLALIRQLALFLESAKGLDQRETQRMLRQIILTSERGLRLTTDLSRASRLDDSPFELEPLNPRQICDDVAHELGPLYKARGREIRVASRYRSTLVVANRELLRRILLNFGDNALHFAEPNSPVDLRVQVQGKNSRVRLGVRDYGPALPVKTWQKLQRGIGTERQTLHTRPQSSGLGLYVAGQFAQSMQGYIGAIRHRDGATFFVELSASRQMTLL
jgi:signal transduction histidine kinase